MTDRPAVAEGISEYQEAVDQALIELCGAAYTTLAVEMAPGMDRDQALLRAGAARGVPPADFARAFQRAHGLALCSASGPAWAERFNLARAALVGFGSEARGWRVGIDGRAYLAVDGGHALRLDVAHRDGKWGFAVSESVGEAYVRQDPADPLRRVTPPDGDFEKLAARLDIGDAVADAIRLRARNKAEARRDAPPEAPAMRMA